MAEKLAETPTSEAETTTSNLEPRVNLDEKNPSLEKTIQNNRKDGEDESPGEGSDNLDSVEKKAGDPPAETTEEGTYITGFRLFLVWTSLSFVAFLMLLDMSIVATVKSSFDPS